MTNTPDDTAADGLDHTCRRAALVEGRKQLRITVERIADLAPLRPPEVLTILCRELDDRIAALGVRIDGSQAEGSSRRLDRK